MKEWKKGKWTICVGTGWREKSSKRMVLDLSPVKMSSRNPQVQYFDGRITDGVEVTRMVCFDSKKRTLLDNAREKGMSIGLKKCKVKENRGEYEIIPSTATHIDVPDKEYIVDESLKADCPLALRTDERYGS